MGRGRQVINVTTFSIGPKTDQQDFEPVYRLKGTINQKTFRKFMRKALDELAQDFNRCSSRITSNYLSFTRHFRSVRRNSFPTRCGTF